MGNLLSRLNNQLNINNAEEEAETTNCYKYPPKSGPSRLISSRIANIYFVLISQETFSLPTSSWAVNGSTRPFPSRTSSEKTQI